MVKSLHLHKSPAIYHEADIVISFYGEPITHHRVKEWWNAPLRTGDTSPFFLVDLAVPRDIEGEVSELDDAYL